MPRGSPHRRRYSFKENFRKIHFCCDYEYKVFDSAIYACILMVVPPFRSTF